MALRSKWRQARHIGKIGMVETHIRLLESQLHLMEDEFPEASIDELVEYCVAVKVR